jgi:hypothetical protein
MINFLLTMGFTKILADKYVALNQVTTNHALKLSASWYKGFPVPEITGKHVPY